MVCFWGVLLFLSVVFWLVAFFSGNTEERKEMGVMVWIFLAFLHISEIREKISELEAIISNLQ